MIRALICATVAAAGLSACGGDAAPGAGAGTSGGGEKVVIKTFMFDPDPLTVEAGTTVTFTNEDATVHTVTSGPRDQPDGRFDEKLAEGESAEITFDEPGRVRYVCTLHTGPGMEGEVIVR